MRQIGAVRKCLRNHSSKPSFAMFIRVSFDRRLVRLVAFKLSIYFGISESIGFSVNFRKSLLHFLVDSDHFLYIRTEPGATRRLLQPQTTVVFTLAYGSIGSTHR